MLRSDRKNYVLRQLRTDGSVSVAELSQALALSEVSVRKLLAELEGEGHLRRTWGGAVDAPGEHPQEEKSMAHREEKQAIAQAAYSLIRDGDAIYLDSGSTALVLAERLAAGDKRGVRVCTNAIHIAYALRRAEDMQVLLIGGVFQHALLSCTGAPARNMLATLFFDKAFLTGSHFSLKRGFTTANIEEAEIKRLAREASRECFALADSSKYGQDSMALIAPAGDLGTLITDWKLPEAAVQEFEAQGTAVLRAKKSGA